MDFLNSRLIAALNNLREEVSSLRKCLEEYRDESERRRRAIELDHGRRDDRAHNLQLWLMVGTWLAFAAAAVYANYARLTLNQIKVQTQAIAGADYASVQAPYVYQNSGDYWYLGVRNVGRIASPIVKVKYFVILFDFQNGKTIKTIEENTVNLAELAPSTDRGENDFQYNFLARGSNNLDQSATKQTFEIKGTITYDNGFGERLAEDFCHVMIPSNNPAAPKTWDTCNKGMATLDKLRSK
jgi:hypothetical protein